MSASDEPRCPHCGFARQLVSYDDCPNLAVQRGEIRVLLAPEQWAKLENLRLCLEADCNVVFDGTTFKTCPRCASGQHDALSRFLSGVNGARGGKHDA